MERIYTLPIGTNGNDLTIPRGQIAGLVIDNPSGSWLRVTDIDEYIPPFTLGWSAPLSPAKLTVDVVFTDSPSGAPSETSGGAVTVTLTDYPVPRNGGILSGDPHTGRPGQARARFSILETTATEAGNAISLVPFQDGASIVPLDIVFTATDPVNRGSDPVLYGLAYLWGGSGMGYSHLAISPAMPTARAVLVPGFRLPSGVSMTGAVFSEIGCGDQGVTITTLFYYLADS